MQVSAVKYLCVVSIFVMCWSCGKTSDNQASTSSDDWKEMDEFHMIMAEAFHPYKDSANLEPAIKNADAMAKSADKWYGAPVPEKVNNAKVKERLLLLKDGCKEFTQIVATQDTVQIGESLTLHY